MSLGLLHLEAVQRARDDAVTHTVKRRVIIGLRKALTGAPNSVKLRSLQCLRRYDLILWQLVFPRCAKSFQRSARRRDTSILQRDTLSVFQLALNSLDVRRNRSDVLDLPVRHRTLLVDDGHHINDLTALRRFLCQNAHNGSRSDIQRKNDVALRHFFCGGLFRSARFCRLI